VDGGFREADDGREFQVGEEKGAPRNATLGAAVEEEGGHDDDDVSGSET
jgi:hypothetical protein